MGLAIFGTEWTGQVLVFLSSFNLVLKTVPEFVLIRSDIKLYGEVTSSDCLNIVFNKVIFSVVLDVVDVGNHRESNEYSQAS